MGHRIALFFSTNTLLITGSISQALAPVAAATSAMHKMAATIQPT